MHSNMRSNMRSNMYSNMHGKYLWVINVRCKFIKYTFIAHWLHTHTHTHQHLSLTHLHTHTHTHLHTHVHDIENVSDIHFISGFLYMYIYIYTLYTPTYAYIMCIYLPTYKYIRIYIYLYTHIWLNRTSTLLTAMLTIGSYT